MFEKADKDGDGKLTKSEWMEVLQKSGVHVTQSVFISDSRYKGSLNSVIFREDVDMFFKAMDRDFDGRLTLEEFMGEETPIEKLFKLMDKNRDGFITKKVQKRLFSLSFHLKIYRNFSLSARR